jgi:transposase
MIQRGKSYSQDLRERVLAADDLSAREVAERFSVSPSYVIKARQRRDRSGVLTIKQRGHRRTPLIAGFERHVEQEVRRRPSATIAELRSWLLAEHGVSVSTGTMWTALRQLGLTLKKSRSGPRSKRVPTSRPPVTRGPGYSPN